MSNKSSIPVTVLLIIIALLIAYIFISDRSTGAGFNSGGQSELTATKSEATHQAPQTQSTYTGDWMYKNVKSIPSVNPAQVNATRRGNIICLRWAVVTTVNAVTPAVQRQAHLQGTESGKWCLLIVADTKSPEKFEIETPHQNVVYLSARDQQIWAADTKRTPAQSKFIQAMPWGHIGRKNVGYLYAVLHGAQYIWDFDDDVMILSKHITIPTPGEAVTAPRFAITRPEVTAATAPVAASAKDGSLQFEARIPSQPYNAEVLNPFPLFEANHNPSWPRGFPIDRVLLNSSTAETPIEVKTVQVPASTVAVVHFLANHDPDVDALYRMIRPLPLDFPIHGQLPLLLPTYSETADSQNANTVPSAAHTVYAPYNAQSTLHTRSALWTLLLPLELHQHVSDIWRSYIAQRLFADIGVRVAFHPPIAAHIRRPKEENLPDMVAELPLYQDTLSLLRTLRAWRGKAATLPGRLEELYVHLFEQGYLDVKDVTLMQLWVAALLEAGYDFPLLLSTA